MSKSFASTGDMSQKNVTFAEIGPDLYAYTAEGDPNSGVIVGEDCCMVIDAQATPAMAGDVIARVARITDKPIRYVVLTHYHAVRVLGASAYDAHGGDRFRCDLPADRGARAAGLGIGNSDASRACSRMPRAFPA